MAGASRVPRCIKIRSIYRKHLVCVKILAGAGKNKRVEIFASAERIAVRSEHAAPGVKKSHINKIPTAVKILGAPYICGIAKIPAAIKVPGIVKIFPHFIRIAATITERIPLIGVVASVASNDIIRITKRSYQNGKNRNINII